MEGVKSEGTSSHQPAARRFPTHSSKTLIGHKLTCGHFFRAVGGRAHAANREERPQHQRQASCANRTRTTRPWAGCPAPPRPQAPATPQATTHRPERSLHLNSPGHQGHTQVKLQDQMEEIPARAQPTTSGLYSPPFPAPFTVGRGSLKKRSSGM